MNSTPSYDNFSNIYLKNYNGCDMACIAKTSITKILIALSLLCLMLPVANAQDGEMISADNVGRLQSVQQIDYADFDADIEIGWFATNPTASEFIVFDNDSQLYRVADDGEIVEIWTYVDDREEQLFAVIDGTFAYGNAYILYTIDGNYWINDSPFESEGIPLALNSDAESLYIEMQIDSALVVYQLDESLSIINQFDIPSNTSQPVMRVGRIHLPMIVQSSFDGGVDIFEFDSMVGEFQVGESPAVFGHINAPKTHFAWSDPNTTYLNLLDFETGENRIITELNGAYVQYYLLSDDASLVIAVNVDFEPNVIAWDTNTGERYDLGAYRDCERIPDKVELSVDGTTLIIGCDTGLELWRIINEMETD